MLTLNMRKFFLFIAGYAFTNRRMKLLSSNFETLLFWCLNRNFWGIHDVKDIVNEWW